MSSILERMVSSKNHKIHKLGSYMSWLWKYRYMYAGMVKKDFKGKYRNSALGYLWHIITPLVMILTYLLIFSVLFGRNMENYWAYLSSGMFAFNILLGSLVGGCDMMSGNANMITKTVFPKEIIVFAKVTVSTITAAISYAIVIAMLSFYGSLSWQMLISPLLLLLTFTFSCGVALLLSAICVYVRDIKYLVSSISMCLMFATPLFYVRGQMSSDTVDIINQINPLTHYVEGFHHSIYYGDWMGTDELIICSALSIAMFFIGFYVFKKIEGRFAERL